MIRHDFQAFVCCDVRLFNFVFLLHHPIWVKKNIKKERGRFREHVREKTIQNQTSKQTNKNKKHKQQTQTNKNKNF